MFASPHSHHVTLILEARIRERLQCTVKASSPKMTIAATRNVAHIVLVEQLVRLKRNRFDVDQFRKCLDTVALFAQITLMDQLI